MHTFGHATEIDRLLDLCRPYNIKVVEDAAEALGSYYYGRHLGTFSDIGTLSFNGNKVVTTGGGGALLFQDEALAKRAKHLTTTAKVPHAWEFVHDQVGYNYRLPNINAALGCAQLEELPKSIAKKRRICDLYVKAFSGFDGAKIFTEPAHCKGNYWLNALILDDAHRTERDFILKKTNADKISTRPIWNLMSELPMYNECPKMDLSVSESLRARVVNLPSSPDLILDSELGSN